jgi:hypothetical protein
MIQDVARVFHSMQENFMAEKFATTLAREFWYFSSNYR